MLQLLAETKLLSSFYEKNMYLIDEMPVKTRFGRRCRARYFWDNEPYILDVIDFYADQKEETADQMRVNWKKCFGGVITDGPFIWPSDYIYESGNQENRTSLVLAYCEKQFEHMLKGREVFKRENAAEAAAQIFRAVKYLHDQYFSLGGISPEMLWYMPERKQFFIRVHHNCNYNDTLSMGLMYNRSDDAKGVYRDKIYGLPQYCCWEQLPLGLHGICNDVYSIATMLFEKLIGRHPLNGKLCDDQEDDNGRMEIFNRYPCFIFSKSDTRNRIGEFEEEKVFIQRWEELPLKLRDMFDELYAFPELDAGKAKAQAASAGWFQAERWLDCLEGL